VQYLHWAPEAGVGEGWENVAAIGVASVDGCYWAAAPPSFEGCATEAGGTKLREKLLLKPVKLKALVLGCGLALIGLTSAAWADNSNAQKCASPYYSGKIKLAKSLSINGTPTFVIGLTSGNQHKGEVISGVVPWDAFKARIDQELKLSR
jgi:hypothetical protein